MEKQCVSRLTWRKLDQIARQCVHCFSPTLPDSLSGYEKMQLFLELFAAEIENNPVTEPFINLADPRGLWDAHHSPRRQPVLWTQQKRMQ